MDFSWIFLVLAYGLLKGFREIAKKLALDKNSIIEVLFTYTFISFLFCLPEIKDLQVIEPKFYFFIALKSLCVFTAWIFSFKSIKYLPISIFGVLDLSRVLFATFYGVVLLHETLGINQIFGLIIVTAGLLLLRYKPKFLKVIFHVEENEIQNPNNLQETKNSRTPLYVFFALLSCFFNATSGYFDKVLMKDLSSSQLQFTYMGFLVLYYLIYMLVKHEKFNFSVTKNVWVYLMAIMFVIGDKCLFIANANPSSKITMMTLIKQIGTIVTILGGKFIFKEKNIAYKLFCAAVIIAGIVLGVAVK